jgi:heat shock protein HslJ
MNKTSKRLSVRLKTIYLFFILLTMLVAACSSADQPSPAAPTQETEAPEVEQEAASVAEGAQEDAAGLAVEDLMNATYSGLYEDPLTLTDGLYEGEQFVEGDPARPSLQYVEGRELFGDLDGDGDEDAFVFLVERGGGTAAFTYVAAQLNQNGQPVDAGALMVEDRTQVIAETIDNGEVILDITTLGPGDVDCCPSHKTRRVYVLESGRLTDISAEDQDLVRISAEDLNGTTWRLLELIQEQPALSGNEVTINFQGNQISGSGGCNNYNSSFSLSEDNPFIISVEPVVATRKACPDPLLTQEDTYFTVLEGVSLWGYDHGHLVLFYVDEQGEYNHMRFAAQVEAENN